MKNNIRDTNNKELQEIIANTILLPDISNLDCLHEPITASFGLLLLYAQLYHYSENKERLFSKIVDLRDFVTVSRRLGLRIDDIESNPAYVGSGLSVYTITVTICSSELKKYKTHHEIIEALKSLDYIYHLEELR